MSKSETQAHLEKNAQVKRIEIHQGKLFKVVRDQIYYENHLTKTFDLILHPGAVALIPVNDAGHLILVKQWRRAANQILIELPAGTLEKGEDPQVCADRELREETGFKASEITPLGGFYSAPGVFSEYLYLYLARGLSYDPLVGDDSEEIDLLEIPLNQALEMIHQGKIIDAKTVAGLLWYNQWVNK